MSEPPPPEGYEAIYALDPDEEAAARGLGSAMEIIARYLASVVGSNLRRPRNVLRAVLGDAWRAGTLGDVSQAELATIIGCSPASLHNSLTRRERALGLAPTGPGRKRRKCSRRPRETTRGDIDGRIGK